MIIYNLHTDGDNWRITKFDDGNPASSYLVSHTACQCPAGERSTCRHRQMLPVMLSAGLSNQPWFLDWDNSRQVVDFQGNAIPKQALAQAKEGGLVVTGIREVPASESGGIQWGTTEVTAQFPIEGSYSTTVSAPDFDSGDGGSNPPAAAKPATWRRI